MSTKKSTAVILLVIGSVFALSACNTTEGV